jgi:hypothetical protein
MDITQKAADTVRCYRFHPETGADANDIDKKNMSLAESLSLASTFQGGAKFYWVQYPAGNPWGRVERSNLEFVLNATGTPVEWIDAKVQLKQTGGD